MTMPDGITPSNFESMVLFILGVLTLLVTVDKGVDAFKHLFIHRRAKNEATQNERIKALEDTLAEHEERLDRGDAKFDRLSADMSQMLKVQNAILMHEITGNNIDRLKATKAELDEYMSKRG